MIVFQFPQWHVLFKTCANQFLCFAYLFSGVIHLKRSPSLSLYHQVSTLSSVLQEICQKLQYYFTYYIYQFYCIHSFIFLWLQISYVTKFCHLSLSNRLRTTAQKRLSFVYQTYSLFNILIHISGNTNVLQYLDVFLFLVMFRTSKCYIVCFVFTVLAKMTLLSIYLEDLLLFPILDTSYIYEQSPYFVIHVNLCHSDLWQ